MAAGAAAAWLLQGSPVRAGDVAPDRAACIAASERGQRLKLAHRLRQARSEFLSCAIDTCPAVLRRDCDAELVAVDESTPTIVLRATDRSGRDILDVRAVLDGSPFANRLDGGAVPIDPGVHTFRLEAAEHEPAEVSVLVVEGEKNRRVSVVLTAREPIALATKKTEPAGASSTPIAAVAFAGAGVTALGIGAYFGIHALDGRSDLRSSCGSNRSCSDASIDAVQRDAVIADVAIVAGALAGAAAVWFFFRSRRLPATASGAFGLGQATF